jgi:hypothetical protein
MTDMWTYRDDALLDADLVGYDVQATDGGIGEIDAATYDAGHARIVVDTGFWIFGKKRMIPAGAIASVDHEEGVVHLQMSKDEVKSAPDFEEGRFDDEGYRSDVETYYESYWVR